MCLNAPPRLLAKSCDDLRTPPEQATLPGHTKAVVAAAKVLIAECGEYAILAAGLESTHLPRLTRICLCGALTHDLGKAGEHFQARLMNAQAGQLFRHEAVSAWLILKEPLRSWLAGILTDPRDVLIVAAAIAGHHRKFRDAAIDLESGLGTRMKVYCRHPDLTSSLAVGQAELGMPPAPQLEDLVITAPRNGVRGLFDSFERELETFLEEDSSNRALLALAKAFILDADVAGSALPREGLGEDWIRQALGQRANRDMVEQVIEKRLNGNVLRPFQEQVAQSSAPIALVQAGCGSGKTLAAYAWFARRHAHRQLWITYPTTGTALEGFRDYLHGVDELVSTLESSRREIDLDLFDLREHGGGKEDARRQAERIASLRAWGQHAITCTVDSVLGLMQNHRKGLYSWAGLSHSAVVFDEIHSYDNRLFATLLEFLDHLPGIPALLMTASLPQARFDALCELCQKRHGSPLQVVSGPRDLECLPRYRIEYGDTHQDPWPQVQEACEGGGKVLWISNTVDRCMSLAWKAQEQGMEAKIYHSRFRYLDRVERHREILEGFRRPGPFLAVTTQVAEMSLDVSADLLISDLAPISALIQRLGRLNRRSTPERPSPIRKAMIFPVERSLPYSDDEFSEARSWLLRLAGRDCSQHDLVQEWEPKQDCVERFGCAWFDGGVDTIPNDLRQASPGITVLRGEDAVEVRRDARRSMAYAVPMSNPPKGMNWQQWTRVAGIPVVPNGKLEYDSMRGARWA